MAFANLDSDPGLCRPRVLLQIPLRFASRSVEYGGARRVGRVPSGRLPNSLCSQTFGESPWRGLFTEVGRDGSRKRTPRVLTFPRNRFDGPRWPTRGVAR